MLAALLALLFTAAEIPAAKMPSRPGPPAEGRSNFLLVLERPRPAWNFAGHDLSATLVDLGQERPADAIIPIGGRVYAWWCAVPPGIHRLVVDSPSLYLADRMIELRSGEVRRQMLRLATKPDVRVKIELPEYLRRPGPLSLEMRPLAPLASLGRWQFEADAEEALLEKLPPVDAEFVLRSPLWTFPTPLDLSRGRDGELHFDPDETNLHGYLTIGGRPAAGKLHFKLPDQKSIEVKTDGRGWYDAFLWRRGLYQIGVEIGKNEPYRFYYELQEVARKVLDIDVPTARYQVRAIDRDTREKVTLKKARYAFRDEEDRLLEGELKISGGKANLPPLGAGRLDLFLMADGYVEHEWQGFELSPQGPGEILVAELDKVAEWVTLILLQGEDEPVEDARVRIQRDGFSDQVLWEGSSDELGLVRVPGHYQGRPVLVRAAGFAFHADLLPEPTPAEVLWKLEKAPPGRTTLVVVDQESRTVAGAEVVIRVGPVWLRGEALAWLVGNGSRGPRTNGDGLMVLRDLPPREMLVLARPGSFDPAEVDGLAYHAISLESPAPPILVVPATP